MKLIQLTSERAWRTYLGGSMLDSFHGLEQQADSHFPEEWIMSITAARNVGREDFPTEGMSLDRVTGQTLKQIIEETPEQLLGSAHFQRYGNTTGVLIKLIDSAERLSIQVHPNQIMAKTLFSSDFGKTECWHILGGRAINGEEPAVYLGFKENVTREEWKDIFDKQDIPRMLDCLHKIPVRTGDTFLIPGGVPHAIGSGCFLMEIQEPTDYTIRTEKITNSGFRIADEMCHQGLGFERMFDCFAYDGTSYDENLNRYKVEPKAIESGMRIIGYDNSPHFQLSIYDIDGTLRIDSDPVFSGLYVLDGEGGIECESDQTHVKKGDAFFVPAYSEILISSNDKPLRLARFQGPKV